MRFLFALDVAVVLAVALPILMSLLATVRDPVAYEKSRQQRLDLIPLWAFMRRGIPGDLLSTLAFGWAAWRADLWSLWAVLSAVTLAFTIMAFTWSLSLTVKSTVAPKGPEVADSVLRNRLRIMQVCQATFMGLWLYAWRGLLA